VCGPITGAPCAVDQEDLSEKLVSAESVSELLLPKANFPALPNHHGKPADSKKILFLSADFKENYKWQLVIQLQTC
jgi:hypothetical protein